jgi:hypothetical protein
MTATANATKGDTMPTTATAQIGKGPKGDVALLQSCANAQRLPTLFCFRVALEKWFMALLARHPHGDRENAIATGPALAGRPLAQIRTCGTTAYGSYLGC